MNDSLETRLSRTLKTVTDSLMSDMAFRGHWEGTLSGSALSTATAVTALAAVDGNVHSRLIHQGLHWLATHQNGDGGWGDTVRSGSNLSTTALVWAAFGIAKADDQYPDIVQNAVKYLKGKSGEIEYLPTAIEARYGSDKTFSIPILMMLALSGRLGKNGWSLVRSLPFELAALPQGFFGALRLPVVSYALPALIAIGQVIHHKTGRFHPVRDWLAQRTRRVLESIQPENGGFLEATPLTSFVTMSLAGMDLRTHPVTRKGVSFITASVREDGSWPIDTNLATWVTSLSVKSLRHQPHVFTDTQKSELCRWLLAQQFTSKHPYTGAAPGGWSWTDLPGAVPDADDTAGVLLALWELRGAKMDAPMQQAVESGVQWLVRLQNRDGGIPTFCRGWGTLPFDRSTPELTAHALRAWRVWMGELPVKLQNTVKHSMSRAVCFLETSQRSNGSWIPLWFGSEVDHHEENPVYGTAMVLQALTGNGVELQLAVKGREFLRQAQNVDGGWGGNTGIPSSLEETALALDALAGDELARNAVEQGAQALVGMIESGKLATPSPIGLYFARLWYFERLYPLIFTVGALGSILKQKSQDKA